MLQTVKETQLTPEQRVTWNKALQATQSHNSEFAVRLLQILLNETPGFLEGRRTLRKAQVSIQPAGGKKKGFLGGMGGSGLKKKILQDPANGLAEFESKLNGSPGDTKLNNTLFEAANEMGAYDLAAFALDSIRMVNPKDKENTMKLVEHYETHNRLVEASNVMNQLADLYPSEMEIGKQAKDLAARASMNATQFGSVEGSRGILKDKDQTAKLEQQNKAGMSEDQLITKLTEAINIYNIDPNNLDSVKNLASLYEELEDFSNAASFYSWATQLAPGDNSLQSKADVTTNKANELYVASLKEQLSQSPDDEALKSQIAEFEQTQSVAKLEAATQAVEANPTDAKLRYELAQSLYDTGQPSDAIPHLQQAKGNPHIKTKVLLLLAKCFDAKGMLDMAVSQLVDANDLIVEMNDTKKEVLYTLGELQIKSGDQAAGIASHFA